MEGNKLIHKIPSIKLTSQNSPSFSLESNEKKVLNNTQECKSPNAKENDDKAKEAEEEHSEHDKVEIEESGREKLKRLREETMGDVKIPENWGQEPLLKDWIDYTMFDALLAPHTLIDTARDALIAHGRKAKSQRLRI